MAMVADPWAIEFTDEEAEIVQQLEANLSAEDMRAVMTLIFAVKWHPRPVSS